VGKTGIAGEKTEHPNHTATPDDFKAVIETERRLLALGFLQPGELNDAGFRLGLRSDDFTWIGHGFIHCYACLCGEHGVAPTVGECVHRAAENAVELTVDCLFDILFCTDIRDGELVNYAQDVLGASQDRSEALLRDLCRDAWRAMLRGLGLDAERRGRRRRKFDSIPCSDEVPRTGTGWLSPVRKRRVARAR